MRQLTVRSLAACAVIGMLGCGASQPPPKAPPAAAESSSVQAEQAPPDLVYSEFTDPLYLAYQDEKNPFSRRTLARMWVAAAENDPPGAAKDQRQVLASKARKEAEDGVKVIVDPCKARVGIAYDRALATKQTLETRYLHEAERLGDPNPAVRALDAQIHVLRDEIEELEGLKSGCKALPDKPLESM